MFFGYESSPYGFLAHTFQVAVCMHGITTTTSTQPQTQRAGPLHVTKLGWHPSQVYGTGAITPILRRERPDRVVRFEQPRDIREHREHSDEEMISRRRSSESSVVSFFPSAPCRRHPYAGFVDQLQSSIRCAIHRCPWNRDLQFTRLLRYNLL